MRALTVKNVYDKKYTTFPFDGEMAKVLGNPSVGGVWLIWGKDKNGKTSMALRLADEFTRWERVLYVSGEEGTDIEFQRACQRVGIDTGNKRLHFLEYTPIDMLEDMLGKRKARKVIFCDNLTIYKDELKGNKLIEMVQAHPDKLFVFLAHEERNEPYSAPAKLAHKLAKVIIHIKGLSAQVYGRCPGGVITIDESKEMLYWGTQIHKNKEE
jgi:predicted ATP-dependent serine protease